MHRGMAEQALGIMTHSVLPQVFARAVPRYVDGEGAADPEFGGDKIAESI